VKWSDRRTREALEPILRKLERTPGPNDKNIAPGAFMEEDFGMGFASDEEIPKGASGFRGMVDFLRTAAVSPGDTRLVPAAKAQTIGDPEAGGYLVPPEYSGRLISLAVESGKIFPLCQSTPMKSNDIHVPVAASLDKSSGELYGGVKFAWVAEEGTKPEKEFKLKSIALSANTAAALCKASNQLLEDSTPRAEDVIKEIFSKSWAWMLDDVVVSGIGAGQPLGILNAPCLYTVAKESGQSAGTIVWKNVQKMFTRLWAESRDSKSLRWLINPEATEQILDLNQPIGTGGSSVIMAAGEGVRPIPPKLLGIPIIWTSHASALGTKGDIILADMNMYLIGIRRTLTAAASIHKYFDTNHTLLRFEGRLDGQPIIPSTIKTRTNFETSPFITLAARA
jgi:HK97 family phage major capsid protein